MNKNKSAYPLLTALAAAILKRPVRVRITLK